MNVHPTKKIGEVVVIESKKNTKRLPYVGMEDVESESGAFLGSKTPRTVKSATSHFAPEHVLYGKLRPYLNKVMLPDFEGHCTTEFLPLRPDTKHLTREWLAMWLRSREIVERISATATGTRMPRANMKEVMKFEIPLPPLAEQKRIVGRLEKVLKKVKEAKRLVAESEERATTLLPAELHAVFSAGTRRGWKQKPLGEVLDLCDSGTWGEEASDGMPLLRSTNMQNGELVLDDVKYIDVPQEKKGRYLLREGDILLTKSSGSVKHIGKALYITKEMDGKYGFSNFTQRLRMDKKQVLPKWVYLKISDPATRDFLLRASQTTTGLRNLKITELKELEIPLPPLAEQKRLVKRLDRLTKKVKEVRERQRAQRADLRALERAVLRAAFC